LPYRAYAKAMRCPDRDEIQFTMLMFIVLAPLGYWPLRTLMALVAS
jgi:ABC-type transport system involved in cytochrome bd biosynthesis fused ATPase/permease subunit